MQIGLFLGKTRGWARLSVSSAEPYGDSWLRTVSLFAKVLWDWWMQAPLANRAKWPRGPSRGSRCKSWGDRCVHAPTKKKLETYGRIRRRQWHPTPVLSPGKSHGRRSLEGCSLWGRWGSDTTEWLHFHALEKEMATHSSVLAWRIPGMEEPGELLSMGSHRFGRDWSDLAAAVAAAHIFFCSSKDPIMFGQMTSQPEVNIILIFFPK